MLPPFHGERMRAYERGRCEEATEREIGSWPLRRAFPLHPRMQAITLEVIMRAVFGVGRRQRRSACATACSAILRQTAALAGAADRRWRSGRFARAAPTAAFEALLREADDAAARRDRRAPRRPRPGRARGHPLDADRGPRRGRRAAMGDEELRDQLMTLLLAGHETTATALAWTFDLLLPPPRGARRACATRSRPGEDEYLRRGDRGVAAAAPGRPVRRAASCASRAASSAATSCPPGPT